MHQRAVLAGWPRARVFLSAVRGRAACLHRHGAGAGSDRYRGRSGSALSFPPGARAPDRADRLDHTPPEPGHPDHV